MKGNGEDGRTFYYKRQKSGVNMSGVWPLHNSWNNLTNKHEKSYKNLTDSHPATVSVNFIPCVIPTQRPPEVRMLTFTAYLTTKSTTQTIQPRIVKDKKVKVFRYKPDVALGGSRRLTLLDLLDCRHYEGGKVVTLTHLPPSPPGISWYSFLEAESTPGHMVPSVASEKIPSDNTGDRSRDLPTSNAVP